MVIKCRKELGVYLVIKTENNTEQIVTFSGFVFNGGK